MSLRVAPRPKIPCFEESSPLVQAYVRDHVRNSQFLWIFYGSFYHYRPRISGYPLHLRDLTTLNLARRGCYERIIERLAWYQTRNPPYEAFHTSCMQRRIVTFRRECIQFASIIEKTVHALALSYLRQAKEYLRQKKPLCSFVFRTSDKLSLSPESSLFLFLCLKAYELDIQFIVHRQWFTKPDSLSPTLFNEFRHFSVSLQIRFQPSNPYLEEV